jgi:hypothetical protein
VTREKADFSGERRKEGGAGSPRENVGGEQEQPTTPPAHGTTTSSRFLSLVLVVDVRTIFRNIIDPLVPYIDIVTLPPP